MAHVVAAGRGSLGQNGESAIAPRRVRRPPISTDAPQVARCGTPADTPRMRAGGGPTRVATVLFLDIVRSTEIATDIGDEHWRAALGEFRRLVRTDLKTYHGHEEDTAGDGFFATFAQPAGAVRCAAEIANDVQSIGLDIRCGLHAGETGAVEGRPGGVAVHAAARVMALAGPAEILCTATVRDLVMGTDIGFEPRGAHELKGVPGTWDILAVRSTPKRVPQPLSTEQARERLEAIQPQEPRQTRRVIVGATAVVVVAVVALLFVIAHHGGATATGPSPSPPPALVRIDPDNNHVVESLGVLPNQQDVVLGARDGSLWQGVGNTLIRRRLSDGHELLPIVTHLACTPTFGFGSAWTFAPAQGNAASGGCASFGGPSKLLVTRYDAASGRKTRFSVPGFTMTQRWGNAFRSFVAGPNGRGQGVWYVNGFDQKLRVIDPSSDTTRAFPTGGWGLLGGPQEVLPTSDAVWLCDGSDQLIKRLDIKTHAVSRPIHTHGDGCPVAVINDGLWVLDRTTLSLTEFDTRTLQQVGSPYGLGAARGRTSVGLSAVGFGSIWLPSGAVLYRFDVGDKQPVPIPMPPGVTVGTVMLDEPSHTVWAGNCHPAFCTWIPP
jgi:class 3 adenylate cyclase/streptogramin lyase